MDAIAGSCFQHLFVLLLAPVVPLHAANHVPSKPNIIILLVDGLGYADLGCHGSKEAISPTIDSIAANGVPLANRSLPSHAPS